MDLNFILPRVNEQPTKGRHLFAFVADIGEPDRSVYIRLRIDIVAHHGLYGVLLAVILGNVSFIVTFVTLFANFL